MQEANILSLIEDAITCYDRETVTEMERKIVDKMINMAITQFNTNIRARLAEKLQHSVHLSPHLAQKLIEDTCPEVSTPMLKNSPVLNDQDILAVLSKNNSQQMQATSERQMLSEDITSVLISYSVETGTEIIVENITRNPQAKINNKGFQSILDRFSSNKNVRQNLCFRMDLPENIALSLCEQVSDKLKLQLVKNGNLPQKVLPTHLIETLINESVAEEKQKAQQQSLDDLPTIHRKAKQDIVTAIFRPLCMGNQAEFVENFSGLIGVPVFVVEKSMQIPSTLPSLLSKLDLHQDYKHAIQKIVCLYKNYTEKQGQSQNILFQQCLLSADIKIPESERRYLTEYVKKVA